jgi:PGF-pre-PGF domain-containing protein
MKRNLMGNIMIALLVALCSHLVSALEPQPVPTGISGYVFELDGQTQVEAGTGFSINNTDNGFYIQGVTGRGVYGGKYVATIKAAIGDRIVITAWNDYHSSRRNITYQGVMRDVNLLIDNTPPDNSLYFNSTPVTEAIVGDMYVYDADVHNPSGERVRFSKESGPQRMRVNSATGLVKWLPRSSEVGDHEIVLKVTNRTHLDMQHYTLTVYQDEGDIKTTPGTESAVTGVMLETAGGIANVTAYGERPSGLENLNKRVYQYVDISAENRNATVFFKVEKSWLEQNSIDMQNVVLNHYTEEGWTSLATEIVDEDDQYVYYSAYTEGFSPFAISVNEEEDLDTINNKLNTYTVSRPVLLNTYALTGVVYYRDRPVTEHTEVTIMNQRTGQRIQLETGLAGNGGAFATMLQALQDDLYTLEIRSPETMSIEFDLYGEAPYEFRFASTPLTRSLVRIQDFAGSINGVYYAISICLMIAIPLVIVVRRRR